MGGNAGFGLRANTRHSFSRGFRQKGMIPLTTYLRTYKVGDYVDVKCNPAVHKGMPFKFYHGRTGIVWNVTKRALGVELNKTIGNRQLKKRIHVRVEHVQPSRCREAFLARREENDRKKSAAKAAVKAGGEAVHLDLKRKPVGPREGFTLENVTLSTITAVPYDIQREGVKY